MEVHLTLVFSKKPGYLLSLYLGIGIYLPQKIVLNYSVPSFRKLTPLIFLVVFHKSYRRCSSYNKIGNTTHIIHDNKTKRTIHNHIYNK